MNTRSLLFLFGSTLSATALAAEQCANESRTIREISTLVKQPHRIVEEYLDSPWLNFMYQPTRMSTVDKYLVFKVGETVDLDKIKESIRKLRSAKFIWDSSYEITQNQDCTSDINITIYDTFPFKPKLSFSQRSGTTKSSIGVANTNLFGTGTRLQFEFKQAKLRDQKVLKYDNPNFGDEHYLFSGVYSDNSDGKESFLRFAKPFHNLDTESYYDLITDRFSGDLQLYNNTEIQFLTDYQIEKSSFTYGRSNGNFGGFERSRLFAYLAQDKGRYTDLINRHRNIMSIGAQLEVFDTDYLEIQNIRNMSKFEDYNQGLSISVKLGVGYDRISQQWGPDIGLAFTKNTVLDDHTLLLAEGALRIQESGNHLDETRLDGRIEWNRFSRNFQQSWNIKFNLDLLSNPRPENYIIMDETFTVRGFPFGYRLSDKTVSLNIEKRWFNMARFFDLFDIAGIAFADIGRVSIKDSDVSIRQQESIGSMGLGFRISPTKLSNNTVIHVDLAFPTADDLEQNYQLNIFAKGHF